MFSLPALLVRELLPNARVHGAVAAADALRDLAAMLLDARGYRHAGELLLVALLLLAAGPFGGVAIGGLLRRHVAVGVDIEIRRAGSGGNHQYEQRHDRSRHREPSRVPMMGETRRRRNSDSHG